MDYFTTYLSAPGWVIPFRLARNADGRARLRRRARSMTRNLPSGVLAAEAHWRLARAKSSKNGLLPLRQVRPPARLGTMTASYYSESISTGHQVSRKAAHATVPRSLPGVGPEMARDGGWAAGVAEQVFDLAPLRGSSRKGQRRVRPNPSALPRAAQGPGASQARIIEPGPPVSMGPAAASLRRWASPPLRDPAIAAVISIVRCGSGFHKWRCRQRAPL